MDERKKSYWQNSWSKNFFWKRSLLKNFFWKTSLTNLKWCFEFNGIFPCFSKLKLFSFWGLISLGLLLLGHITLGLIWRRQKVFCHVFCSTWFCNNINSHNSNSYNNNNYNNNISNYNYNNNNNSSSIKNKNRLLKIKSRSWNEAFSCFDSQELGWPRC